MPMFNAESESDAVISEHDLEQEQRRIGFGRRVFGKWALMKSARRAETRQAKDVFQKEQSLNRARKQWRIAKKFRDMSSRMASSPN